MMKSARVFLSFAGILTLVVSAAAQEGHPLTGTWYGDFGPSGGPRRDLTVVMDWNGQEITGIIDPGPNAIPIRAARLDVTFAVNPPKGPNAAIGGDVTPASIPPKFMVHFEVDAPDKNGVTNHCIFEGTIQNPVAGNRRIVGTWTCGREEGEFSIRRL